MKCYNIGEMGHFACECIESKKVPYYSITLINTFVSSSVMLAESHPMWVVDLGLTDYIARDQEAFVEHCRI